MNKITQAIAATLSFCVLGVIVYWGFLASSLDPQKVPVIRKVDGPARVAPEDPGGEQASHQGLSVNEVQSSGSASDAANRVVLAPQTARLAQDDLSVSEIMQVKLMQEQANRALEPVAAPEITQDAAPEAASEPSAETGPAIPLLVGETAPNLSLPDPVATGPEVPMPKQRPRTYTPKPEVVANTAPALTEVPVGTKLIQLGAFDSPEIADAQWQKMLARHGDLLSGKQELVQKAQSGGRTFYRLRAVGFKTSSDAKSLCTALTARGTACLAVTAR